MSKFVVIEGLDGAGTTTQAGLLAERLRESADVVLTHEPSNGPIGTLIRQMLAMRVVANIDGVAQAIHRETLALLFAADRRDHIHVEIEPALAKGHYVVTDRYYHSSFAYQGDVDGEDRFDIDWVRELNSRARRPDITFLLEADTKLCIERLGARTHLDLYESQEKLERLAKRYDQVMSLLEGEGENIIRLDAALPIAELHNMITTLVLDT